MPIYEYRCSGCGHEKEVLQKLSDAPLTDCPACGKPTLKKLISAAGFHLKGSGWYATDFRGGNKPKGDEAAKADAKAGDKGGEDKGGDKGASGTTDDSRSKESGSKESGSKEPRSKESGSKESKPDAASTGAAPAPAAT